LQWYAVYSDGTIILEKEQKVSYRELDRTRLVGLGIAQDDSKPDVSVDLKKGEVGFYRKRTSLRLASG